MDHVVYTLGNLYYAYSSDTIDHDVREHMLTRLEHRWKNAADHELFLTTSICNPYTRRTCFNRAVLSNQDIEAMFRRVFARIIGREPEPSFTEAVHEYLDAQGDFSDTRMGLADHLRNAEAQGKVGINI